MCYNEEKEGVSGMKKYGAALMAVLACIALTGCGQSNSLVGTWQEDYFEKTCPAEDDMQNHVIVFNEDGTFSDGRGINEDGRYQALYFDGSYGNYENCLTLSRVTLFDPTFEVYRQTEYGIEISNREMDKKKYAGPLLTPPPGKYEWEMELQRMRVMKDSQRFYYRISGNHLYIISAKVNLEKGSMVNGKYHFVR